MTAEWLRRGAMAGVVALALAACSPPSTPPGGRPQPAPLSLTPVTFEQLPGWQHDRPEDAVAALRRSCPKLIAAAAKPPFGPGSLFADAAAWGRICAETDGVAGDDPAMARLFFERWFQPYRGTAGDETRGLLTGYYEPSLRGSLSRGGPYTVPLYRPPETMVTIDLGRFRDEWADIHLVGQRVDDRIEPMPTRVDIVDGALANRGLELVWVDDAVDAFFLQIQGSGRIVLPGGDVMRVGYAAKNGHAYTAIGRELIARGAIERDAVSMQTIQAWLRAHPADAPGVMDVNESYVFFRENRGDGPVGAQGVALTAGRSLAVDRSHIPFGVPVWLDAQDPLDPAQPLQRLVIAQDTGGAIRGPLRGDLFWGAGDLAAKAAGTMKERASFYLLLPRLPAPSVASIGVDQGFRVQPPPKNKVPKT